MYDQMVINVSASNCVQEPTVLENLKTECAVTLTTFLSLEVSL